MQSVLDHSDLDELKKLNKRSLCKGLFLVIGPKELFQPAIEQLKKEYASRGITGGIEKDLETITPDDVDELVQHAPPVLYLKGSDNKNADNKNVLERLNIRRDYFLSRRSITILFFIPTQYREFTETYSALSSNALESQISLGGQRTMDEMGEDCLNRFRSLLGEIDRYEERLDEAVNYKKDKRPDHLVVLRRWNSFSPILSRRPPKASTDTLETVNQVEETIWRQLRREIRGGGYFFSWRKFGIAVDPGHNFIDNLYQTGYSVRDIDSIVITHDHLDHHADFEAIVDLLYQCNKRGDEKKISVFLNPTTYTKYYSLLKNDNCISRIAKLKLDGNKYNIISPSIRLHSLHSNHTELSGKRKAASLLFRLSGGKNEPALHLGFTADTGWHAGMKDFFSRVDVLVAHIGSIKRYELEEARLYGNHLGILGLFKVLQEIHSSGNTPTVILSEFGEELMGFRDILGKELCDKFEGMRVFPADIGHTVELKPGDIKILCGQNSPGKAGQCSGRAEQFFEHNGEIALRCERHRPALGAINS
ncbi:MAG: hypothetical protein GY757_25360 [bacterium]|nr:hypothetical protein [bacterium]